MALPSGQNRQKNSFCYFGTQNTVSYCQKYTLLFRQFPPGYICNSSYEYILIETQHVSFVCMTSYCQIIQNNKILLICKMSFSSVLFSQYDPFLTNSTRTYQLWLSRSACPQSNLSFLRLGTAFTFVDSLDVNLITGRVLKYPRLYYSRLSITRTRTGNRK